jgi:nitrogen-specific signal transduction histidine kinase
MLDLELFSDPVIAIDKRFQVTNSNSIFMQFYNVNKRKVIQKRLDELFELSEEFINNEVPFNMLVPKEIGVLFGSRVSQNVQVFKTYHPDYEGQVLVHLKDVDAEVKLHNKNLNKLNSSNDLVELDLELLEEILEEEKMCSF